MTFFLKRNYKLFFLLRSNSAEHTAIFRRFFKFFLCFYSSHINCVFRTCYARIFCDILNGFYTVARNNLKCHSLFFKIIYGIVYIFTEFIFNKNNGKRSNIVGQTVTERLFRRGKNNNSYRIVNAFNGIKYVFILILILKYKFSSTHYIGFTVIKIAARPLGFGRERIEFFTADMLLSFCVLFNCKQSCVFVVGIFCD